MDSELDRALDGGATCITATERLAAFVRHAYGRRMAELGRGAWLAPAAYSWEGWVRGLWERRWSEKTLLPRYAARVLWEEIIAEDAAKRGVDLLDIGATAEAAQQAHSLVSLYEITVDRSFDETEECAAFARWRRAFLSALAKRNWLTAEDLDAEAALLFSAGDVAPPKALALAGFDEELPAARSRVLAAAEAAGAALVRVKAGEPVCAPGRVARADLEDEVRSAALWAVARLSENPDATVGIVAIDMEGAREAVERLLPALLIPQATVGGDGLLRPPYDLSLGGPLAGEAVVETALLLLRAVGGEVSLADFRKLLRSPFWGAGADIFERAPLAARLADLGRTRLSIAEAGEAFSQGRFREAAGARDIGAKFLELAALCECAGERAPSAWAESFAALLAAAGWGKTPKLESREYQAAEKFKEELTTLGALDAVKPRCDAGWARARLASFAASPFRPKIGEARIQVMGALEAAGLAFDHLWVLGVSDGALPAETRANPFIPYHRQLSAHMRQASPAMELERARAIVARLAASAGEVLFSWPAQSQGASCAPSPLIAGYPEVSPGMSASLSPAAQVAGAGRVTLAMEEDKTAPVTHPDEVRGGATLFAWQAQCPFKAYVGLRLGAREEEEVSEGLDRRVQGELLHHAVKELHALFPSLGSIRGASDSRVEEALDAAIRAGLKGARDVAGGGALLEVEGERMRELLRGWLAIERERPDFEVLEREAGRQVIIGGIKVSLRIDRLDSTEDGGLVIDYKTSTKAPSTKPLLSQRLTEPQLPLYALACEESSGVAYAHMQRGGCKLIGVAQSDAAAGVKGEADWQELKKKWRERLEVLALEFTEGRADPDPAGERKFCGLCGLDAVCRVAVVESEPEGSQ